MGGESFERKSDEDLEEQNENAPANSINVINIHAASESASSAKIARALYQGASSAFKKIDSVFCSVPSKVLKGVSLTAEALKEDPYAVVSCTLQGAAGGVMAGSMAGWMIISDRRYEAAVKYVLKNTGNNSACKAEKEDVFAESLGGIDADLSCSDKNAQRNLISNAFLHADAEYPWSGGILKGAMIGGTAGVIIGGGVGVSRVLQAKRVIQNATVLFNKAVGHYQIAITQIEKKQIYQAQQSLVEAYRCCQKLKKAFANSKDKNNAEKWKKNIDLQIDKICFKLGELYENDGQYSFAKEYYEVASEACSRVGSPDKDSASRKVEEMNRILAARLKR